jgi:hypothetical protein
MTPVPPFWQTESHALIARNITLSRAQIFTQLLLPRAASTIALKVPICLPRLFRPILAYQ